MRQKHKSVRRRYKSVKKIRHILEFIFLKLLFVIIKRLPHRTLFWISATIGHLMFKIPSVKKLTTSNVQASFRNKSNEEVKRIACGSLSNLIQNLLELIWFSGEAKRQKKYLPISVKTNELVKEKTRDGKGLILVAPHVGNWELLGLMGTTNFGLPFAAVAKKQDNPYLDKLIIQKRSAEGTSSSRFSECIDWISMVLLGGNKAPRNPHQTSLSRLRPSKFPVVSVDNPLGVTAVTKLAGRAFFGIGTVDSWAQSDQSHLTHSADRENM